MNLIERQCTPDSFWAVFSPTSQEEIVLGVSEYRIRKIKRDIIEHAYEDLVAAGLSTDENDYEAFVKQDSEGKICFELHPMPRAAH